MLEKCECRIQNTPERNAEYIRFRKKCERRNPWQRFGVGFERGNKEFCEAPQTWNIWKEIDEELKRPLIPLELQQVLGALRSVWDFLGIPDSRDCGICRLYKSMVGNYYAHYKFFNKRRENVYSGSYRARKCLHVASWIALRRDGFYWQSWSARWGEDADN